MPKIDESRPISEMGNNKPGESGADGGRNINIEKNVLIHTMPKKFKVSSDGRLDKKTKIVGAVIMVVGALVLIALVYLAYIYLIKAPAELRKPADQTEIEEEEEKEEEIKKEPPVVEEEIPEEEEIIEEEEEEEEIIEEVATTTKEEEQVGTFKDSDSDGLSDLEEVIFGSNLSASDSDEDGYLDKAEVENLYNPAGPGALIDNQNISKYQNTAFNYSIFYVDDWMKQAVGDGSTAIFGATDGSFVQIIAQANDGQKTIGNWFSDQFPERRIGAEDIVEKNNCQGIFHENEKIFYLTGPERENIFIISYVPEPEDSLNYYNIFKMAINSFQTGD